MYTPSWSVVAALPPFHLFSLAQVMLPVTFVGGSVTLRARFDPREQLELIASGQANDIIGVAAMFHRLVDQLAIEDYTARSGWRLTSMFLGGDVLPEPEWQRFRDAFHVEEVTAGFGMTELQGTSFMTPPESPNEVLAHSVGWPSKSGCAGISARNGDEHEWQLVDVATGTVVLPGRIGELRYRGPSVSPGYWRVPLSEDASHVDGWFCSGDLGYTRSDGTFVFLGRNSEVFRSGGELVSPTEVESVIADFPGVDASYVVGVRDRRFGQVGFAWIVNAPGKTINEAELLQFCRDHLARYKVPKHVHAIAAGDVPVSASGKFLRREDG